LLIDFQLPLNRGLRAADTSRVTIRGLSLVVLVLALAIGGYVFARQAQTVGPTSEVAVEAREDASAAVATVNLQAAVTAVEEQFAQSGTYVGARVSPALGAVVVRADNVSYCLQDAAGTQHVAGPGGALQPGPC
jgi:hypothetical protein